MNAPGSYKPRPVGSTKEVVDILVDLAGGPKQVAFLLGRSKSRVAAWTDQAEPGNISFDYVCRLTALGHTVAVEHMAALAGGTFVPSGNSNVNVIQAGAMTHEQAGQFASMLLQAHADGKLDSVEGIHIVRAVGRLISSLRDVHAAVQKNTVKCSELA